MRVLTEMANKLVSTCWWPRVTSGAGIRGEATLRHNHVSESSSYADTAMTTVMIWWTGCPCHSQILKKEGKTSTSTSMSTSTSTVLVWVLILIPILHLFKTKVSTLEKSHVSLSTPLYLNKMQTTAITACLGSTALIEEIVRAQISGCYSNDTNRCEELL